MDLATSPDLPAELAIAGETIYGPRWKARMAEFLQVDRRTISRWMKRASPIPVSVALSMRRALNGAGVRDEWIVGTGHAGGREYVVHTKAPRFVARLVAMQGSHVDPLDADADVQRGVTRRCRGGNEMLCEFAWFDPPPHGRILAGLLDRAENALDDHQRMAAA